MYAEIKRVYDCELLRTMGSAFDVAWPALASKFGDNQTARRKLALLILRHVDRGEKDATRLAELALFDFA